VQLVLMVQLVQLVRQESKAKLVLRVIPALALRARQVLLARLASKVTQA
jgi:hypothetical protein